MRLKASSEHIDICVPPCSTCNGERNIKYERGVNLGVPCPECCAPPEGSLMSTMKTLFEKQST